MSDWGDERRPGLATSRQLGWALAIITVAIVVAVIFLAAQL